MIPFLLRKLYPHNTSIEGSVHATPPLANFTIAGTDTAPTSKGEEGKVGNVGYGYRDSVVWVKGLEEFMPDRLLNGALFVKLSY